MQSRAYGAGAGRHAVCVTIVGKGVGVADMMTILRDLVNGGIVGILAKGGLVMIPLLAASVISLAVIIERFMFWRRLRKRGA